MNKKRLSGSDDRSASNHDHPSVARRRFLQALAAATLTGGAGAAAAQLIPIGDKTSAVASGTPDKKRQWAMVIDMRRCDGCAKCTKACQQTHHLPQSFEWIKVFNVQDRMGREYYMPRPCMQCENAPCLRVCPVAATFKNDEGVILVDQDRCIGCRLCMAACPYGARYFNYDDPPAFTNPFGKPTPEYPVPQRKGTVGKCMFCVHNSEMGKLPACVEACPMGALYIGDLNEDVAVNGLGETVRLQQFVRDNDGFRYKEELNTSPRVYYITGHGQALDY
jgi:molybdopterin-containing oxidoreductase family iron-sulfur binding subunit